MQQKTLATGTFEPYHKLRIDLLQCSRDSACPVLASLRTPEAPR